MKNYNRLILLSLLFYALSAVFTGMVLKGQQKEKGQLYKVGINRILAEIKKEADAKTADGDKTDMADIVNRIDLQAYEQILSVAYLPASGADRQSVLDFYDGVNGAQSSIRPYYKYDGTGNLHGVSASGQPEGYLRFDYRSTVSGRQILYWAEGALLLMELFMLSVLFYLKHHLVQPFHKMQDMVFALSKGNLQGEVRADKNQYFGKFLWGLNELKDELRVSRMRELELQKQKKLLLLSLSHDIKTPLNMIQLYAKALEDGIYPTEAGQKKIYRQICEKAVQIEKFAGEIMKASREDIIHIEVEKGEFYLKDLVQWMENVYGEKCALRRCSLTIGAYQNRMLRGDVHRLMEVFENLFANAWKYGDGRVIQISFDEEDYCQLIRMFNTGETVSQEEFVHLFDSFFRGKNTRGQQGNGLGLYICREIMQKMDGGIFAVCEKEGMSFVVAVPLL